MVAFFLRREEADSHMPTEVADTEEFVKIAERATECRVKRLKDIVRLKLRTSRQLYTIKVQPEKATEMLKQIRCEVIEA
jgi:ferritin-like protein